MLRKIRVTLAVLFFAAVTLLFLDFTGTLHAWLGWTARIQFLPALMALNLGVMALLVVLTLVFGRVYCSVICPLGVMQDIFSHISGRRRKHRFRFFWSPAKNWLRYGVLALFVLAMVAGIGSFVALLAPYSSYGRIAANLFAPLYDWGNNLLAWIAERADSYAFYSTDVWIRSIPTFVIAAATFVIIGWLSWRNGRTYCNTICPVGTVLGFLSRFSLFGIKINTDKCVSCGICSRKCKSSCINGDAHAVDYSRCVACMDCIDACTHDAITFGLRYGSRRNPAPVIDEDNDTNKEEAKPDGSRRAFLVGALAAGTAAALKAQSTKVDGGLAVIEDKKVPERTIPIVPPGAISIRHLSRHCTGCQLCVAECPNGVLRPSTGLTTLMQPRSEYERGFCRPECTRCSEVCPTGAIIPITRAEKSAIKIGHAVWVADNCLVLSEGITCGNCARHCPSGAIQMVPMIADDPTSPAVPVVNEARCIGCGACEYVCPARPFSAIYVEGDSEHSEI